MADPNEPDLAARRRDVALSRAIMADDTTPPIRVVAGLLSSPGRLTASLDVV